MSLLDKLFGRDEPQPGVRSATETPRQTTDEQAIVRYQYMLRTAPPEDVERAHREAFEKLTPEQRRQVLQRLGDSVPPEERPRDDDPQSLARAATRAEMRQPGALGGMFSGGGMGLGGIIGGSLLGGIAGSFIGSSIAHAFFSNPMHAQGYQEFAGQNGVDANDSLSSEVTAANATEVGNDVPVEPDPMGDPADSGDFGGDLSTDLGGTDDFGMDF